jgi:hypothetical protein
MTCSVAPNDPKDFPAGRRGEGVAILADGGVADRFGFRKFEHKRITFDEGPASKISQTEKELSPLVVPEINPIIIGPRRQAYGAGRK